ncbi:hypothetical protein AOLI_G00131660 [Acnodon oligacanthus]
MPVAKTVDMLDANQSKNAVTLTLHSAVLSRLQENAPARWAVLFGSPERLARIRACPRSQRFVCTAALSSAHVRETYKATAVKREEIQSCGTACY